MIDDLRALNAEAVPLGSFGAVVGATIGEPGDRLDFNGPFLAPGYGAQGGTTCRHRPDLRRRRRGTSLPSSSRERARARPRPRRDARRASTRQRRAARPDRVRRARVGRRPRCSRAAGAPGAATTRTRSRATATRSRTSARPARPSPRPRVAPTGVDRGAAGLRASSQDKAPDDIHDEWHRSSARIGALASALDDAGVDPATYDREAARRPTSPTRRGRDRRGGAGSGRLPDDPGPAGPRAAGPRRLQDPADPLAVTTRLVTAELPLRSSD